VAQVYGTQTVGLIIGITHVCIGGAAILLGVAMCAIQSAGACYLFLHTFCMYWFDRQSNRHRILIEDSDFGEDAPATHASTSSFFAAASINRAVHGLHAPPASPRATDL
jgi:hypothetical protein